MKFMETRPPEPKETVYNDAPKALRPSVEDHLIRSVIGWGVDGSLWLLMATDVIGQGSWWQLLGVNGSLWQKLS